MEQVENTSNEILNFWFGDFTYKKWWFVSTVELDQKIYSMYYNQMLNVFNNFNLAYYNNIEPIKLITDIILLDQFSRNISRVFNQIDIISFTNKAQILSNIWIEKKYYLTEPIAYTVFAFLPIRHSKNPNEICKLLPLLAECKPTEPNQIYNKFLTHTLQACKNKI